MLGAAGVLAAELTGNDWVKVQAAPYWIDTKTQTAILLFLFHWVEINRLQGK